MEHGRDHDERQSKAKPSRHNNTPPDDNGTDEQRADAGHGSEHAPTGQAADREHERHRLEREQGRVAAGTDGNLKEVRGPEVTREKLDDAAREADEHTRR
jgi:hypothetical protein